MYIYRHWIDHLWYPVDHRLFSLYINDREKTLHMFLHPNWSHNVLTGTLTQNSSGFQIFLIWEAFFNSIHSVNYVGLNLDFFNYTKKYQTKSSEFHEFFIILILSVQYPLLPQLSPSILFKYIYWFIYNWHTILFN